MDSSTNHSTIMVGRQEVVANPNEGSRTSECIGRRRCLAT
jgi:hypothetical protein